MTWLAFDELLAGRTKRHPHGFSFRVSLKLDPHAHPAGREASYHRPSSYLPFDRCEVALNGGLAPTADIHSGRAAFLKAVVPTPRRCVAGFDLFADI